jgi:hypothetical protein
MTQKLPNATQKVPVVTQKLPKMTQKLPAMTQKLPNIQGRKNRKKVSFSPELLSAPEKAILPYVYRT